MRLFRLTANKPFHKMHKYLGGASFTGPQEGGGVIIYKHRFLSRIAALIAKTIP